MENLVNETHKLERKINLKNDEILSFAVDQEKRVDNILKTFLCLIVYLRKQGDLQNQLGPGLV